MTLTTIKPALYCRPQSRQFSWQQETALGEYLQSLDVDSDLVPLKTLSQLLLTADGLTQADGYRYTYTGFSQVAHVSAGMCAMLPDIAGVKRQFEDTELYDLPAAIGMFNTVVSLRFSLLKPQRLLINHAAKTVEGLCGPGHRFLENYVLHQQVSDTMRQSAATFYGALVLGRRLCLWYRDPTPLFSISAPRPEKFWRGYYFCNGETSGTSLRGTHVVFNRFGGCLGAFGRGLIVRHVGQGFDQRMLRMLAQITEHAPPWPALHKGVEHLLSLNLNVVGSPEDRLSRERKLSQVFVRRRLPYRLVKDMVYNALCVGSDTTPVSAALMQDAMGHLHGRRTAYDLYCAVLRQARSLGLHRREKLEQLAYELLLNMRIVRELEAATRASLTS